MSATIFWEPVKVNVKPKSLHALAPSWFIACLERADEREACAKLCDEQVSELYASRDTVDCADYLAGQIRARGTT